MANKTKFLASIMAAVSDCLGDAVECNVKQVLKGKDPEGANRLLQNLAKAADTPQSDGMQAVQVCKIAMVLTSKYVPARSSCGIRAACTCSSVQCLGPGERVRARHQRTVCTRRAGTKARKRAGPATQRSRARGHAYAPVLASCLQAHPRVRAAADGR